MMISNVLQFLEKNVLTKPDKIAIEDDADHMTYIEYCESAKKIGTFISQTFTGERGCPVAVLIDRGIKSIVAFMGVVYSGNFYVPIDPTMPEERVSLILDVLSPVMIIDARRNQGGYDNAYDFDRIINNTEINESVLDIIRKMHIDTDPLYAIFTSGSTGTPKGVLVSHRSVLDLVYTFEEAFHFSESTVFGNQAPFDFDVSVKDIYNALYVGGTVEVIAAKLFKTPKLLIEYLIEKKIDTLIWAVSALRIVSDFKTLDDNATPELKNVMFSGEVMPVKSLNYWMDKVPGARYVNLYGPTEITCNCTYHVINQKYEDDKLIPVGKAFANRRVFIRNEKNEIITKRNEVGEICVCGTCLALGYYNDEKKTRDAFVQNPGISEYPSAVYTTGDMGYYDENDDIVFAARKDNQIKHMGHRIELGEVEAALNSLKFITIACCIYDRSREKIVCFYQAENECKKDIVMAISKKLPKYMWPNVYIHRNELPMNKNGKIDRVMLGKEIY